MIVYMHNNVIFEGATRLIFGIAAFFFKLILSVSQRSSRRKSQILRCIEITINDVSAIYYMAWVYIVFHALARKYRLSRLLWVFQVKSERSK